MTTFGEGISNAMRASVNAKPGEDRLTPAGRKVVEVARREALSLGKSQVEPEHLLLAIIRHGEGPAAAYLREQRVNATALTTFMRGFDAGQKAVVRA